MASPPGPASSWGGAPAELDELRARLATAEAELVRLRTVVGVGDPDDPDGLARALRDLREQSQARRRQLSELLGALGEGAGRLA